MKTKTLINLSGLLVFLLLTGKLLADPPPPPPPGGHGSAGNQPPVGAPIDGGLGILMAMGAAYGGSKYFKAWKKKKAEEKEDQENTKE